MIPYFVALNKNDFHQAKQSFIRNAG